MVFALVYVFDNVLWVGYEKRRILSGAHILGDIRCYYNNWYVGSGYI